MNKLWLLVLSMALWGAIPSTSYAQGEQLTRSAYKVLDNRFRLDHGIDEVTLVIYRTPGAGPAVLVRPDGSKLYAHTSPANVNWFGEGDFDIITIQKPMPGPWQIIGSLDRRNNIEILSDLQLVMGQAPRSIYQGERLKLTAELRNYGNRLNVEAFYKSTELSLYLIKRQLNETGEVGATDTNKIGRFFDNGTGLDEYPHDGIFTGEMDFKLDPGRYQLFMNVSNKTFSRAVSQDVELKKNPIQGKVIRIQDNTKRVHYSVNPVELKLETVAINLLIQGSAEFQHPISIVAPKEAQFDVELDFLTRTGDYRINGWLFGTTMDGREVAIAIPTERFSIINDTPPLGTGVGENGEPVEVAIPQLSTGNRKLVGANIPAKQPEPIQPKEPESSNLIVWLLSLAVLLLLAGGGAFWFFKLRKKTTASGQDSNDKRKDREVDLNSPEER